MTGYVTGQPWGLVTALPTRVVQQAANATIARPADAA